MKNYSVKKQIRSIILIILCILTVCSCQKESGTNVLSSSSVPDTPEISTEYVSPLPENKPTDPLALTFCDTELNSEFLFPNSATEYQIVEDRFYGQVLKLTLTDNAEGLDPSISIDYGKYMSLSGLSRALLKDCKYAVCNIKTEKTYDARMTLEISGTSSSGTTDTAQGNAEHKTERLNWQYVVIELAEDDAESLLDKINVTFLKDPNKGEALYIASIVFVKDSLEALYAQGIDPYTKIKPTTTELKVKGIKNEYSFLHLTDLHSCAISSEDKALMNADRLSYAKERRNTFYNNEVYTEDRLYSYFKYAENKDMDLVIMTGDILDFPSKANVSLLYKAVSESNVKTLYNLGNHDWSFKDDYHTLNAKRTNIPLFSDLNSGDPYFSYVEYDDLIVAAIDNSTDKVTKSTVDKFLALFDKGKSIILTLHVPLYTEKLAEKSLAQSNLNLTMGGEGMHADDENVKRLYEAVCIDEDTPVVAVLSGHLHYNFEDTFPNGVTQYVTGPGYNGSCRIISFKPE